MIYNLAEWLQKIFQGEELLENLTRGLRGNDVKEILDFFHKTLCCCTQARDRQRDCCCQPKGANILSVHYSIKLRKKQSVKLKNFEKGLLHKPQTYRATLVLLYIYVLLHFNILIYISKLYIFHFHVNFLLRIGTIGLAWLENI